MSIQWSFLCSSKVLKILFRTLVPLSYSFCKGRTLYSFVRDPKISLDINKTRQIAQEIIKVSIHCAIRDICFLGSTSASVEWLHSWRGSESSIAVLQDAAVGKNLKLEEGKLLIQWGSKLKTCRDRN